MKNSWLLNSGVYKYNYARVSSGLKITHYRRLRTLQFKAILAVVFFTAAVCANAQTEVSRVSSNDLLGWSINYSPKLQSGNVDMSNLKKEISEILKKATVYDEINKIDDIPKDAVVQDDRIELTFKQQNSVIYFSDMLDYPLSVVQGQGIDAKTDYISSLRENYHLKIQTFGRHTTVSFKPFKIQINSKVGFYFREKDIMTARVLADHLFFIRRPFYGKRYESQIALFGPIAAQYRALKIKPTVSEEQRKYIVQANSLNQQKEYGKAIELYSKAIDLDQTAYPAAYSNIALLSAQVRKFDAAIYYMKKYLLLEPDASDARGAQDKIYEWEAGINK